MAQGGCTLSDLSDLSDPRPQPSPSPSTLALALNPRLRPQPSPSPSTLALNPRPRPQPSLSPSSSTQAVEATAQVEAFKLKLAAAEEEAERMSSKYRTELVSHSEDAQVRLDWTRLDWAGLDASLTPRMPR